MLTSSDFEYIARVLKDESGITLEAGKEYLVTSRIDPMAKRLGYPTISALVQQLKLTEDTSQRKLLVEALTTHETSFFRDSEPFEALRKIILPEIIKKQQSKREITIWCGAASSGQEPYSIGMLLREYFPALSTWKIQIVATDISKPILDRSRTGEYCHLEINRGLPNGFLEKYFDARERSWVIKPEIRSMMHFSEMNLLKPFSGIPVCDLVFLRNVLIYFDVPTKREILERVRYVMKPHGVLFLGTAETTMNVTDHFERIPLEKTSCYRLRG